MNNRSSIPWREFLIIECYYDTENSVANGYAETNPTVGWDDVTDLVGTLNLLLLANHKPILDLDNFPNIWDGSKHLENKEDED